MADNREKTVDPGPDDSCYGDVLLPPEEKNVLGSPGATIQSTDIPLKIQQLFDDAGAKGGLLQTAKLRSQIARFLHKHRDEDFG
jgi:hypothetical protein